MNTEREKQLATMPIPKLMRRLAIPMVIAQLINMLYNMVDRIYIGRLPGVGDVALTGLGVAFPIILIVSAFSSFAGAGGAPLASIQLGKGNRDKAEKFLGNALSLLIFFSVVLTIVFSIFKVPLLYVFGASDNTISYATDYLSIYLVGTVFVQLALGLNMFISSQGQTKTAMMSVLIGAVLNIILDPIFIFGFNMGVKGAALATIISQGVSAVWVVRFLCSEKSSLRIRLKNIKPDFAIIGQMAALGVSPFIMQATESAIMVVFNSGLKTYGGYLYVGSMIILQSVMQMAVIPIQGYTQGVQPIISYNYGAKNFDRVKETIKRMFKITTTVAFVMASTAILLPRFYAGIFTTKPELIDLIAKALPVYMIRMLLFGLQLAAQMSFIGLGQAGKSLFVALFRKVILLIPLALILPKFFGVMGIYYAEPIADILSVITATTLFALTYKKILSEKALDKI